MADSIQRPSISEELFHELIHYFKYASSAYSLICLKPNGNHLVSPLSNPLTNVQGYIARDDERKELVIAFRGSTSVVDFLSAADVILAPFTAPVILPPSPDPKIRVHSGFLVAWCSVAPEVFGLLNGQTHKHPQYELVTVGHSLGGALATLAAVTLKLKFPEIKVRTYSYGSPRVGNKEFADFINTHFGKDAYRVVHTDDGVPTIIPESLGYHHHGIEYWETCDPPASGTTVECMADGEDQACSASIPSKGFTVAHTVYLGISAMKPFCH